MANPKGAERVKEMVNMLRTWQGIERQAISETAEILEQTKSPLVGMIMEIIRHDSLMHHRVQQFLIDSVTKEDVAVTREDVAEIWGKIEAHDQIEKKAIDMAKQIKDRSWSPVHKQLLSYLLADEEKHDRILEQLAEFKVGMTRGSGA